MTVTPLLDKAINIAVRAHGGQVDKGGQPYIWHVLRVGMAGFTQEEQIVGVLHDVVEDTTVPLEVLRDSFGDLLADAVLSVSRRQVGGSKESYREYVMRAKLNPIGRAVKINDLLDNLNPDRLHALPVHEWEGMRRRYEWALNYLRF